MELLRAEFENYINRDENPLRKIDSNFSNPSKNHSKSDPVHHALRIIDSSTDNDLVCLAYRALYKSSMGASQLLEILKKHQRHVILLTSAKNWKQAQKELATLRAVFKSSKRYLKVSWLDFLTGIDPLATFPVSLVASYHFLVFQTLLQCISSNVLSILKEQGEFNTGIFMRAAQAFLETSNVVIWLEKCTETETKLKYYGNCVKMLEGMLKVGDFIKRKDSGMTQTLGLSLSLLKLKVMEFKLKLGSDIQYEELPQLSNDTRPFLKDLKNAIDGSEKKHPTFLRKLSEVLESSTVSLDSESTNSKLAQIAKRLTQKIDTETLKDLQLHVKLSKLAKADLHYHQQILQIICETEILGDEKLVLSLMDAYSHQIQNQTDLDLGSSIENLVSELSVILARLNQPKRLKLLESRCFSHYKSSSLQVSLAKTVEIEIHYATLASDAEFAKIRVIIERCLLSLARKDCAEETLRLALNFVEKFQDTLPKSSLSRLIGSIACCFAKQPHCGDIWFGRKLSLEDETKTICFVAFVDSFKAESLLEILEKPIVNQFVSCLHLQDQSLNLKCLYHASQIFQVTIDVSRLSAVDETDHLLLAGIKTKLLNIVEDQTRTLKEIEHHLSQFTTLTKLIEKEDGAIALSTIRQLLCLGYYKHARSLLTLMRESLKISENKLKLEITFLSLDCLLQLSDFPSVPDLLREAGDVMKSMHSKNESVDCNYLIRWKLIQLEYFAKMQDEAKFEAKFKDIENLMLRYPEYNLKADNSTISLDRRLRCLLHLSRFLILTSDHNSECGSYVLALKNLKLAMKLLTSMMRRLETSKDLQDLKTETEVTLCFCYRQAFQLCRHLGLLKDAKFYLDELEKLNTAVQNPNLKGYNYLFLAYANAFVGRQPISVLQAERGEEIANSVNSDVLRVFGLSVSIMQRHFSEPEKAVSSEEFLKLQNLICEVKNPSLCYLPFSLKVVSDFVDDCQSSFSSKSTPLHLNEEVSHKRQMISKAMSVVSQNLQDACSLLAHEKNIDFDELIKLIPHFSLLNTSQELGEVQKILFDCKEILQNCLDRFAHLEVRRAKQINAMFSRCVFLLSFVAEMVRDGAESLLNSVYSLLDLPKRLPYINQRKMMELQSLVSDHGNELLPVLRNDSQTESLLDFDQKLRILLPSSWIVVTIDVCTISGDLVLSKLTAGSPHPVLYKMPLRNSLAQMSFGDINSELKRIIAKSNMSTSAKVTSQVKSKEDRKKWWELRFGLDLQLKKLLDDVEQNIIGSFSGIFSHPERSSESYRKFSVKLTKIWQMVGKFNKSFCLEENLVDMFFFAKPTSPDGRFDASKLEDLVIFTARELQVKLTNLAKLYSQLEALYDSVEEPVSSSSHLVLIPSTSCCSFPWESLNVMKNKSVSRLPSVDMLSALLEKYANNMFVETKPDQIYSLVNPGQDLKRTQARFEPIFNQAGISGLYGSKPEENELLLEIFGSKLYVYLGHGGGEQYYRSSTMLKSHFESCQDLPPAILMGCSSGAYEENGELEPTSNVFNWLICGSPMVVTNLWDITDKDIDNFSQAVFTKWGLLPLPDNGKCEENISLAIMSSRSACTLRYLNGAAPVLHGLPLGFR